MNQAKTIEKGASSQDDAPDARMAGLLAFHKQRKQDSRTRLLAAAIEQFCERGYPAVSIEDIASAAGVSRVTFYRHFSSKAALTAEVFKAASEATIPSYLAIGTTAYTDRTVVRDWIVGIFAADQANRRMLRVFTQATADEVFTERAQQLISDLIAGLGRHIPAFRAQADDPERRRRWHEAWLLLYELLDQSNHAALGSGIARSPEVIDILTDRFLAFVERPS